MRGDEVMSSTKEELIEIIDYLPKPEQMLLLEIAKRFMNQEIDISDIEEVISARNSYDADRTISHNFINWD